MVVSAAEQLPDTYKLWRLFSFPADSGPKHAFAVPTWVANQLNPAYSIMLTTMMAQFWSIVIGIFLFFVILKRRGADGKPNLHPLVPSLWNKKADLIDSMSETISYTGGKWRLSQHPWVYGALVLIFAVWVGQTALGILVPPLLILGNAAPVDPTAIYVPSDESQDNSVVAARFALEAPWALRALGSAQLGDQDLRAKVNVSQAMVLGQNSTGEPILQIDYGYQVTGVDFGLQMYPDLVLNVTGSCFTEYHWYRGSVIASSGEALVPVDYYYVFDNPHNVTDATLFQGLSPVAFFFTSTTYTQGTLPRSNNTWAAIISSVNRTSFTPGADPWYLTGQAVPGSSATGAAYTVKPGRPALSCWQDDVWSYKGRISSVDALTSDALPGLELSDGMQDVILRYLGIPMITEVATRIGPSALLSATTSLGQIFDASTSSVQSDLQRLVLAAYIATTNIFTDSTLYPAGAATAVPNMVLDASGQVMDGVADFVVWSSDVSALSLVVVVVIPCLLAGISLIAFVLLHWTPVGVANALGSNTMFQALSEAHPQAIVKYHGCREGAKWHLGPSVPESEAEPATESQGRPPNDDDSNPAEKEQGVTSTTRSAALEV